MTLQFGEVVLINVQFRQAAGAKVRPAPVLLNTGDEDFLAAHPVPEGQNTMSC